MINFTGEEKEQLRRRASQIPALLDRIIIRREKLKYPFLPAGAIYKGIWQEHNQDNLFITGIAPDAAWGSMDIFMRFQREDGLLPSAVNSETLNAGFAQIQAVYPFARCALKIAKQLKRPEEDFARIRNSAARYDAWLGKYRDPSGTGLVGMFCEFDTGHDNSPRVTDGGLPRQCPERNAGNMPELPCMPILAPDLSAMRYGGMEALAELAEMFGDNADADFWRNRAGELKEAIMRHLYCPEDEFFYDRSPQGFRKYRTEHITRMFLNRVVDQSLFDRIYQRYFTDENEFNTAYPFPSVSVSDPSFCKELPYNCWGGNTQMLTLLRLFLFMDFYRRGKELDHICGRCLRAFLQYPENRYAQELNPFTGEPIGDAGDYVPAILLFRESCRRLNIG